MILFFASLLALFFRYKVIMLLFLVHLAIMQIIGALYFICQARALWGPLSDYLNQRPNLEARRKIGRLVGLRVKLSRIATPSRLTLVVVSSSQVFWITASAVVMLWLSLWMIFGIYSMVYHNFQKGSLDFPITPTYYFSVYFFGAILRVGTAHAQVCVPQPNCIDIEF